MNKISNKDSDLEIVCAYVVFRSMEGQKRALKAFQINKRQKIVQYIKYKCRDFNINCLNGDKYKIA